MSDICTRIESLSNRTILLSLAVFILLPPETWAQLSSKKTVTSIPVRAGNRMEEEVDLDEITLLWGITPPANAQLVVSRGPGNEWVIYLIDTDVPQPEPPDLAEWAICSATFEVGEEFMNPEVVGSDNPYSAAWGYFTPDVSAACPSPPPTQVVSGQVIGARITSPDDPSLVATVDWFFSFAVGSQLDEWGADFVPPMTVREEIASKLAWENVFPIVLDGGGGGQEGCVELPPKSPGMAQRVLICAPPIEASVDPCLRASQVCRANALDTAHAAYEICHGDYKLNVTGALILCATACAAVPITYGICAPACVLIGMIGANEQLQSCLKAARLQLRAANRSCSLGYWVCCEANDSCIPVLLKSRFDGPVKKGAQP